MKRGEDVVVAVTGASGSVYGRRLVETLLAQGRTCHLLVSAAGAAVVRHELDEDPRQWPDILEGGERLSLWGNSDLFAPFCSGSSPPAAMAIVPCSMGTLGRVSAGTADTLLTRAADVCLKERVPLVLAVRETPLSLIHLENMARVTRAGGIILPASPGFYHRPRDIGALVDHLVGKILDAVSVDHRLFTRWGEQE